MMTKFSPQIFKTHFRLYGRVTTRENCMYTMYTVGSFLYVIPYGVSSFNFFASGAPGLQKLYSRVVN